LEAGKRFCWIINETIKWLKPAIVWIAVFKSIGWISTKSRSCKNGWIGSKVSHSRTNPTEHNVASETLDYSIDERNKPIEVYRFRVTLPEILVSVIRVFIVRPLKHHAGEFDRNWSNEEKIMSLCTGGILIWIRYEKNMKLAWTKKIEEKNLIRKVRPLKILEYWYLNHT